MLITKLSLKNFRNYSELSLKFSPEINFITGSNGSGKTNILEAVSIASNIRSFRNIGDTSIIKWGENFYYCSVSVNGAENSKFEVGCSDVSGKIQKKIKIDGTEIRKAADYYGKLLTVFFSPSDINIINGPPDNRRRFIDSVISKIDAAYLNLLYEFKKILLSRNTLLKKIKLGGYSEIKILEVWDEMFSIKASEIISARGTFIERYGGLFKDSYRDISDDEDAPYLFYKPSLNSKDHKAVRELLIKNRNRDIKAGTSTAGPQRDDYLIAHKEGLPFISYASQGQRRTAAIALKIAEFISIEDIRREKSVLLVDDIFSELDESRRKNMVKILGRGNQVIFTMVNINNIELGDVGECYRFRVESGGNVIRI